MKRPRYKDDSAPIIVGVDPARFGSDSTVIAIRQGRDIIAIKRYKGDDTMTVVGHVIECIEEYQPAMVVVDEGGVGGGVVDRLKEQRYKIRGVNFGNKSKNPMMYGNMRAQIWGEMRNWLKTELALAVVATCVLSIVSKVHQFNFKRIHVCGPVIQSEMGHVGKV
jgi:hypothetical protein